MSSLPYLLVTLRSLDQTASHHNVRMTAEQSRELADFLSVKLALPWRRCTTRLTRDAQGENA